MRCCERVLYNETCQKPASVEVHVRNGEVQRNTGSIALYAETPRKGERALGNCFWIPEGHHMKAPRVVCETLREALAVTKVEGTAKHRDSCAACVRTESSRALCARVESLRKRSMCLVLGAFRRSRECVAVRGMRSRLWRSCTDG
jgi:hypothetical protein